MTENYYNETYRRVCVFDRDNLVEYLITQYAKEFDGRLISAVKLQKGLYFLFAFWGSFIRSGKGRADVEMSVDNFHDYLFDADFSAWHYGPVDKKVYNDFKNCLTVKDLKLRYNGELRQLPGISDEEYRFAKDYVNGQMRRIFLSSDFGLVDLSQEDYCWKNALQTYDKKINGEQIIEEYVRKGTN